MKDKVKPNIKPAANIRSANKQEQKRQNKFFLIMSFVFLIALLISFMVPVYYVPLFSNISSRYGLSIDIARKLTLLDLALNSFGIETKNMAETFKKQEVVYEPDVFLSSRFESGTNRLINARETYYHEYEKTRRRPAEIAGIYQNGNQANTPQIDGDLKGVRALPKDNYFDDDGFTDFSYKKATATTSSNDEVMGSSRRQVRGSFDRQEQGSQSGGQGASSKKHEPLPDFASSIYDEENKEKPLTLANSRMVQPVVSGEPFTVKKSENIISQLVADKSFTDMFSPLSSFGGQGGVLGYYVKDDLPTLNLLDFFGLSGQDVFTSYFYSYAAVGRKYIESSKHLSEIAFHGDEPQEEVLIAKGQEQDKIPTINEADMSPISLILTVKRNMKECQDARAHYKEIIVPLNTAYNNAKEKLRKISHGDVVDGLENVAERGAPGRCVNAWWIVGQKTELLRNKWNSLLPGLKEKCEAIKTAMRNYAEGCKMEYIEEPNKDTCDSIDALELGTGDLVDSNLVKCEKLNNWLHLDASPTFDGCGGYYSFPSDSQEYAARQDCVTKITNLFEAIDTNIRLEAKPGFVFN